MGVTMKNYLFEQNENGLRFVGHYSNEDDIIAMDQEELIQRLVKKFKNQASTVYPYMTLISIAAEMGLDRDDDAVNQAWDIIA